MAINFDRIPTENPFVLPEPGIYRARIAEAKMTPSKTPGKPPYIAVFVISCFVSMILHF